jgi:HEAT repeat protein
VNNRIKQLQEIGATRDSSRHAEVLEVLRTETAEETIQVAATTLGLLGAPDSLGVLVGLLAHVSANVRLGAVQGLTALGDARAVPRLAEHLDDEGVARVWWPSPKAGGYIIGREAALAIDSITGERLRGDAARVDDWIARNLTAGGGGAR